MTSTEITTSGSLDSDRPGTRHEVYTLVGMLVGLTLLVVWSYANSLAIAAEQWMGAQYSHGWLVPLFAIALLWLRGEPYGLTPEAVRNNTWGEGLLTQGGVSMPERLVGVAFLSVGLGGRLYCTNIGYEAPELFTIIPTLAGVFMLVGGWRVIKWAGPAIAFLFFMCPLPYTIADHVFKTLQKIATIASTFVLQTLGFPAFREGNTINLGPDIQPLNVIDQCSGLRMLTIFIALCFAVAMVIQRPMWERIVIVLTSIPIALAVNVARISITGMMHVAFHGTEHAVLADRFFHDFAGWVMMPMAMILLFLEFVILQKLTIAEEAPKSTTRQKQQSKSRGQRKSRHKTRSSSMTNRTSSAEATMQHGQTSQ